MNAKQHFNFSTPNSKDLIDSKMNLIASLKENNTWYKAIKKLNNSIVEMLEVNE